ncbi:MAG: hypothetical protein E7647_08325 [Ruminococcaceae bacterium]|nr:hypothetical protein [Oscillospiraceae bacterium]
MQLFSHVHTHGEEGFHILGILWHTVQETALILPFMFLAFLVIGMLERGAGRKMISVILAADKVGPLAGGLLGALPSCGFSAASSNLFGAGLLTTGTLLAVYLSTSDEMIAVMVANRVDVLTVLKILAVKVGSAVICGFLVDGVTRLFYWVAEHREGKKEKAEDEADNNEESEDELIDDAMECGCSDAFCAAKGNLFTSSLVRTLRIFAFVFAISLVLNIVMHFVDKEIIAESLAKMPVLGCIITGFLGLIPNCAVSVALTEFWLDGIISAPMMLSGLMTGAGSGLIILLRTNKNKLENVTFICLLLVFGILFGSISGILFF